MNQKAEDLLLYHINDNDGIEITRVDLTFQQVKNMLEALGVHMTERGTCDRTDDCGGDGYDMHNQLITSDYYVVNLFICHDCSNPAACYNTVIEYFDEPGDYDIRLKELKQQE